jgi:hypothetical protein
MIAHIVLNNMIIEDEQDLTHIEIPYESGAADTRDFISPPRTSDFVSFVKKHEEIRDSQIHFQLKNDLIEHLWQLLHP